MSLCDRLEIRSGCLMPQARCSGELEGADLPPVSDQLEPGGDGAGASTVTDVEGHLGTGLGDEARVRPDELRAHGLDGAAAGPPPRSCRDEERKTRAAQEYGRAGAIGRKGARMAEAEDPIPSEAGGPAGAQASMARRWCSN